MSRPLRFSSLPIEKKMRSRHGDEEKADGEDEEDGLEEPLERRDAAGQRGGQMRCGEQPHGVVAAAMGADFQQHEGDDRQQADQQPDRREKAGVEFIPKFGEHQGTLRQRVWARQISKPRKSRPG